MNKSNGRSRKRKKTVEQWDRMYHDGNKTDMLLVKRCAGLLTAQAQDSKVALVESDAYAAMEVPSKLVKEIPVIVMFSIG